MKEVLQFQHLILWCMGDVGYPQPWEHSSLASVGTRRAVAGQTTMSTISQQVTHAGYIPRFMLHVDNSWKVMESDKYSKLAEPKSIRWAQWNEALHGLVREGRHPGGHKEYVYDDILDDTWIATNQTLRKTNDMILLLRLRLKNIYRLKESKKIDDIVVDRQ